MILQLQRFSSVLETDPSIWKSDKLAFLRERISFCESYESDEEEAPPPESNFERVRRARVSFDKGDFESVITYCDEVIQSNPNNATAYRLRSQSHWRMDEVIKAYYDMCEAQTLDYDDEFVSLHSDMKTAFQASSNKQEKMPEHDFNFQDILKNPKLMYHIQDMMKDPRMFNIASSVMNNPSMRNVFADQK